jgi:hypothetical protein
MFIKVPSVETLILHIGESLEEYRSPLTGLFWISRQPIFPQLRTLDVRQKKLSASDVDALVKWLKRRVSRGGNKLQMLILTSGSEWFLEACRSGGIDSPAFASCRGVVDSIVVNPWSQ